MATTRTTLNTRIKLKYDSYANWTKDPGQNLVLLAGEVAVCAIPSGTTAQTVNPNGITAPQILFKVGDGTTAFKNLPWASGLAADVYSWAKASEKPSYAYGDGKLTGFGTAASHDASDFDGEGAAAEALEEAKAYTDSAIAGISGTDTLYQIVFDGTTLKLQSKEKNASAWADVPGQSWNLRNLLKGSIADGNTGFINGDQVYDALAGVKSDYEAADAEIVASFEAADAAITSAYIAADSVLKAGYENADAALESAYKAADAVVTSAYKAADAALESAYKAADTSIRTDFAAADASIRADFADADAAIVSAYEAADDALESAYKAADSALESAYKAADSALKAELVSADASVLKAAKDYADEKVAGAVQYVGTASKTEDLDVSGVGKGDFFRATAAFNIADDMSKHVEPGDLIIAEVDDPSAILVEDWSIVHSDTKGAVIWDPSESTHAKGGLVHVSANGDVVVSQGTPTIEEVKAAISQIGSNTSAISALETSVGSLSTSLTNVTSRVSAVESKATSNASAITSLASRMTAAEGDIDDLQDAVDDIETAAEAVEARVTTAEGKISTVEGKVSNAEGKISTVEGKVSTLETKVSAVESKATSNASAIASLASRVSAAESDIDGIESDIVDINGHLTNTDSRVSSLEGELNNTVVRHALDVTFTEDEIVIGNSSISGQNVKSSGKKIVTTVADNANVPTNAAVIDYLENIVWDCGTATTVID